MKKPLDFLILLAPILLWLVGIALLGDQFSMPNRLVLTALCTSVGAAALLTNRKIPGLLAMLAGLGMLASVPISHEIPKANYSINVQQINGPQSALTPELWKEIASENSAEILAFPHGKTAESEALHLPKHPFSYESCQSKGPIFYAQSPIVNVREQEKLGKTQLKGELLSNDSCISFAILDLSNAKSQLETQQIMSEFLGKEDSLGIALIDTGRANFRIPDSWIQRVSGYSKSPTTEQVFLNELSFKKPTNSIVVLNSMGLRCLDAAQSSNKANQQIARYTFGI
jgi:hypothetical protein